MKPRKSNVSGFPFPQLLPVRGGKLPELDQPRFLRLQLQAELRQPFPQLPEKPLESVPFWPFWLVEDRALQYRRILEIRISPICPKKFPLPSQLNLPP